MHAESRAVRLDVYVKDEKHTIYNVEMQCESNANLPRRSRYYQSMIDMDLIDKNDNYNKLNQSFIIFICTFDPFKKGRHQYTFENRCLEDTALGLDDKTTKIFLNTKGTTDDVSNELLEFLTYLENSSKEQADRTDCGLIKLLHERVNRVRASREMEVEFVKLWMIEKEKFEEGKAEGREEGREEGKAINYLMNLVFKIFLLISTIASLLVEQVGSYGTANQLSFFLKKRIKYMSAKNWRSKSYEIVDDRERKV